MISSIDSIDGFGAAPELAPTATAPDRLPETPLVRRVREFLEKTESTPVVTIRAMATAFRLSRSHLQKTFKLQTGVCMGEWITEYKLQRAANLLENSDLSVKEIAYTIGYVHPSSFIRAFERRFTEAPTCYRKLNDGKRAAHRWSGQTSSFAGILEATAAESPAISGSVSHAARVP